MRAWLCCAVITVLASGARSAHATPTFPDGIKADWELTSLPVSPSCLLCHTSATGGSGTATTPFAKFLVSRGLTVYDDASLQTALAANRAERHDSDGNGVPDYDDIRAGKNPNAADSAADAVEQPTYGCSITTRSHSATVAPFGLAVIVALGAMFRRRANQAKTTTPSSS